MNTSQLVDLNRHVYRFSGWSIGLFVVIGIVLAGISAPVVFALRPGTNAWPDLLLTAVPFLMGAYFLIYAIRSRLIIEGTRIEVRGVFTDRTADRSEIEGFRTIRSRNSSHIKLFLNDGRGGITIPQNFSTDDDFRAWFAQITDLDERDKQSILDEIAREQTLGSTADKRLAALSSAKIWGVSASVATIAAAAMLYWSASPGKLAAAAALALIPLSLLFLVQRSPLLYTIFKQKKDPRFDLSFAFLASGFGLVLSGIGKSYVSYQPLLWIAVPVAIVVFAALFLISRNGFAVPGSLVGFLLVAGLYGFGVTTTTNIVPDQSTPVPYRVQVLGKHISHGKSNTYYLDLEPWGPIDHLNSLSVPSHLYRDTAVGSQICVALHSGMLNAPWYQRVDCDDPNGSNSSH